MKHTLRHAGLILAVVVGLLNYAQAQEAPRSAPVSPPATTTPKPEFPPHTDVIKDYTEVVSTIDRARSLLSLWVRNKDDQALIAFPEKFDTRRFFIALTVASGETYAGLQSGEMYVYFRRQDNRMVLLAENLDVRSTGDPQSKAAVSRLFTDRVIADVPILGLMPQWGPIIDLDGLLVGQAEKFFGQGMMQNAKRHLARIKTAKAFPGNIEIAFEIPMADGVLKTLHYSISEITPNPVYKTRKADERVGYFTTSYSDLGKYQGDESRTRFVNRWHLEKADPQLKVSPVKDPIIFYIEHTTPIRYRRWVREGALMWNKAFEKVGLANAIEVYYQDSNTRAHMEKDPEDVRYNFIRWLNNDIGTAIGPSRVNPLTGQILDADIILTDGWIRHYWRQFNESLPEIAMEGFSPDTLAWLRDFPEWDPRVRLAAPASREAVLTALVRHGPEMHGGHPLAAAGGSLIGDHEFDGLVGRTSQVNGFCRAAECKALDMAVMRFSLELWNEQLDAAAAESADSKGGEKKKEEEMLDGIPEWFVGPLIAELVAHEVGHTLGLRHNFKASSIYSLAQINSTEVKGKKAMAGSVMDYLPVNMFRINKDDPQGDYTMIEVGPYDMWAIEYGYSLNDKPEDLKKILGRVSEPELQYATDEDTFGPDPFARRYDFAGDPLAYAKRQMDLVKYHRGRLTDKFVKEGQSWARTRHGYEMTISVQFRSLSMMANWVGSTFVHRDKKGDPNGRPPLKVVPAKEQRDALQYVIENAFQDEAFGLNPALLQHLSVDKWLDDGFRSAMQDSSWPVHDRVMGIQASVLTMLLNPSTLGRAYDNEFATPIEQDMITLPEIFDTIHKSVWTEIESPAEREFTARKPMISSLRRNLQREHLERLINLSIPNTWRNTSHKPVSNLAISQLRKLSAEIAKALGDQKTKLDAYSEAHLSEARMRIEKALDMTYTYTANAPASGTIRVLIGSEQATQSKP
jgi:hypothetical protein